MEPPEGPLDLGAAVDALPDGVLVVEPCGRVVGANPAFLDMAGLGRDEVVGLRPPFPWWPPDMVPAVTARFGAMLAGRAGTYRTAVLRSDGVLTEVEATSSRFRGRGGDLHLVAYRDITERRAVERALRDSERRYRATVDRLSDGVVVFGADGRISQVNPAAARIVGVPAEELVGTARTELPIGLLDERGAPLVLEEGPLMRTLATGTPSRATIGIIPPDGGATTWVVESCEPFGDRDDLGRPESVLMTLTDVTDLRRAQTDLREREARYRALFGYHPDAVVRLGLDGTMLGVSPSVWRVLRYDPDALPEDPEATVHPDDLGPARAVLARAAAGETDLRLTLRMRRGDGRWVWVDAAAGPVFDADGHIAEVQLSLRDATDRVVREHDANALREISVAVVGGAPAEEVFAVIARELAAVTEADGVAVLRFEDDLGWTEGFWADGDPPDTRPPAQPVDLAAADSAAAVVRRTGRPAVLRVMPAADAGALAARRIRPGSAAVAVPIILRDAVWGALVAALPASAATPVTAERMREFADLAALAIASIRERERLRHDASTDPLTGLANRRAFHVRLGAEVDRARRHGHPLSLVLLDLDRFHLVNEAVGHRGGDEVLREVGARMAQMARAHDVVGRLAGEEFAWILPETASDAAAEAADRLREAVAAIDVAGAPPLTASLGVSGLDEGASALGLIVDADAALHEAKRLGRDRVERVRRG